MSYLITASLLNAWRYLLESEYGTMEDFLHVLHRLPTEKSEAMAKGDAFERWAKDNLPELQGAAYQVALSERRGDFLFYGRLDFIRAGVVYDTKFTSKYEVGKYLNNPQTAMYLELVPEASRMEYIISNSTEGETIWRERYARREVRPIMNTVIDFRDWLSENGLLDTYQEKWRARE